MNFKRFFYVMKFKKIIIVNNLNFVESPGKLLKVTGDEYKPQTESQPQTYFKVSWYGFVWIPLIGGL